MNIAKWFRFDELEKTVKRFPLPVLCSFSGFTIAFLAIFDFIDNDWDIFGKLFASLMISFLWFSSSRIFIERAEKHNDVLTGASIAVAFLISFFVVWVNDGPELSFLTTTGSLILLIGVAPYIARSSDDIYFWLFNKIIWFGVAVSFLASLVFFGGSAAALASIDYLFGVDIPHELYEVIGAFCFTILGPVYALSFAPYEFSYEEQECSLPSQLNFITNWILAPLVAVYLVILYAYYLKIGVTWSVPKGELAYITSGFAVAGIVTYLVSWPARLTSGKILSLISKYIFPALILPTIMLLFAIWMRIDQYGFTERRYIVLAFGLWFGFLSVGFTLKKLELKHITLSFAVLLFLCSWGPWGMTSVSIASQKHRLETLLTENGLLKNGAIQRVEGSESLSFDTRKNISSVISYLTAYRYSEETRKENLYGYSNRQEFHKALGFDHISKYQQDQVMNQVKDDTFNFRFSRQANSGLIPVKNYDFYVSYLSFWKDGSEKTLKSGEVDLNLTLKDNKLTFRSADGNKTLVIDLTDNIEELIKASVDDRSQEALVIKRSNGHFKVELSITSLVGEIKNTALILNSMNGTALITVQ